MCSCMNGYKYCFFSVILFSLLFLVFAESTVADEDNVTVEHFYFSGCTTCDQKEDILNEIEQLYGNNITMIALNYSENKVKYLQYGFGSIPQILLMDTIH